MAIITAIKRNQQRNFVQCSLLYKGYCHTVCNNSVTYFMKRRLVSVLLSVCTYLCTYHYLSIFPFTNSKAQNLRNVTHEYLRSNKICPKITPCAFFFCHSFKVRQWYFLEVTLLTMYTYSIQAVEVSHWMPKVQENSKSK